MIHNSSVIDKKAKISKTAKIGPFCYVGPEVELSEKRLMCELKQLNVNLGERVGVLEKYRWIVIGGAIIIGLWGPRIMDNGWFSWIG